MPSSRHANPVSLAALGVALLALAVALGGAAYAVTQAPKNSVVTKSIKNNAVTGAKIKDGNVTGADLANGSVTGADLANGSVGAADLDPAVGGLFLPASRVVPVQASMSNCVNETDPGCTVTLAPFAGNPLELTCTRTDTANTVVKIRGTVGNNEAGVAGNFVSSDGNAVTAISASGEGDAVNVTFGAFGHGSGVLVLRDGSQTIGSLTFSLAGLSQAILPGATGSTCRLNGSAVVF
jgi:hypothetical protein